MLGSDAALNDKKGDSVEASKFIDDLKELLDLFNLGGCSKDLLLTGIDANQVRWARDPNRVSVDAHRGLAAENGSTRSARVHVCVCATYA